MEEGSKRDISAEWIKNNVYEALEKIEECERRMENGCDDLMEYMNYMKIGMERLPEIQLQNMKIQITEFDILIENTKDILKGGPEEYKKVRNKLDMFRKIFEEGFKNGKETILPYRLIKKDKIGRIKKKIVLTPLFDKLKSWLKKLRSTMIGDLHYILYVSESQGKKRGEV